MSATDEGTDHGFMPMEDERPDGRCHAIVSADHHLQPGDPDGIERLLRAFEMARERTRTLVLLGDVFDVWIGGALHDLPEWQEVFAGLRRLHEDGVAVHFLPGNRDFLFREQDGARWGMQVHGEEWSLDVEGRRLALLHGDQLLSDDRAYQRYKRVVRSRPMRALARRLPAAWSRRTARRLRSYSDQAVAAKDAFQLRVSPTEVGRRLAAGADAVVCGHVHRALWRREAQGELFVLPPFLVRGTSAAWIGRRLWQLELDGRCHPFPEAPSAGAQRPG